jgi:hypothetical protein
MRLLAGRSELWLRFPSLVFSFAAAFVIYRLAKRLVHVEVARIAVITFAVWPSIAFAASDARPYALATLAVVASTWALIAWLDAAGFWWAMLYVVLAASIPFVHPVFGIVLIPQAVYALARIRERSTHVRTRDLVLAAVGIGVLTLPVVLELPALWQRQRAGRAEHRVGVLGRAHARHRLHSSAPPIGRLLLLATSGLGPALPRSTVILLIRWLLIPAASCRSVDVSPIAASREVFPVRRAAGAPRCSRDQPSNPQVRRSSSCCRDLLGTRPGAKSGDMRGALALVMVAALIRRVDRRSIPRVLAEERYTIQERQGPAHCGDVVLSGARTVPCRSI